MQKVFQITILTFLLFILFGCKKSVTEIENGEKNGKVFVITNVKNAEIFLDNKTTNKFTPDTITALATGHTIKVRKTNYFSDKQKIIFDKNEILTLELNLVKNNLKRIILLENFTNVNCNNCVEADNIVNDLNLSYKNSLMLVNYHIEFPSSNDPFYKDSELILDLRANYYGVFDTPTIVLDGNNIIDKINKNSLVENVESQLISLTSFVINVQDSVLDKNGFNIAVFLDVFDTDNLNFNSLFLQIILLEKNLKFSEPIGNNGKKEFTNIVRALIPNGNGRVLSGINKNGRYKFFENTLLNPLWKTDNLFVIAFVQNNLSKEVLQVGSSN